MRIKKSTVDAIENDLKTMNALSIRTMEAINADPHFVKLNRTHRGAYGANVDWGGGLDSLLQFIAGTHKKSTACAIEWGKIFVFVLPILIQLLPLILAIFGMLGENSGDSQDPYPGDSQVLPPELVEKARGEYQSTGTISPETADAITADIVANHLQPHITATNPMAVGSVDWSKIISILIPVLLQILPLIFGGATPPNPPFPPTVS